MKFLLILSSRLNTLLALIGAAAVVAMMAHICLDVALRNLFRHSMNSAPEIVARYYMVGIAFLPLAWLEQRRDMIQVELLDFAMSDRIRRWSDVTVMLIAALVYLMLARATWPKAFSEMRTGAFVELVNMKMPVWHSYFLPPLGFSIAVVACLLTALVIARPQFADLDGYHNER